MAEEMIKPKPEFKPFDLAAALEDAKQHGIALGRCQMLREIIDSDGAILGKQMEYFADLMKRIEQGKV